MKTDKLLAIQASLKAPKNQKNSFGGYNYRSCEDILEAVKPILYSVKFIVANLLRDRWIMKEEDIRKRAKRMMKDLYLLFMDEEYPEY